MIYVVIGGGCWGSFHTRLLRKARAAGRIDFEKILVVDRDPSCAARREFARAHRLEFVQTDWLDFYVNHLERLSVDAQIVPAPIAPHLAFHWLVRTAAARLPEHRIEVVPFERSFGLPYEHLAADGCRYISAAAWLCPTTCRAPAICPAIQAERTWDLGATLRSFVAESEAEIQLGLIFQGRHQVFGLETIGVDGLLRARQRFLETCRRRAESQTMVATISPCHGAVNLVRTTRLLTRGPTAQP